MKRVLVVCALALACKREEDAPQVTATTSSAPAQARATATGPTQLVALTQPVDSAASTAPVPTLTPTQTPTPTSSQVTANARARSVVVGAIVANGPPAESVQRVVRKNFGRYRQCYETGLKGDPALKGRMMVRLTIDASGSIASAEDAGSDLQDSTSRTASSGRSETSHFRSRKRAPRRPPCL